tara:strand:- start:15 stop:464 length:450 start_codon:yes stop_codon:yes gene_type:complete
MIEFELQVDPSFLEALLPFLGKVFRETSGRFAVERFAPPESGDEDLDAAWREGLIEDGRADRMAFSRLLKNPKLAQGQVEIPVDEVDDALRGMTELRIHLREHGLKSVSDEDLENGRIQIEGLPQNLRIAYLGYILVAEMQERLIQEVS